MLLITGDSRGVETLLKPDKAAMTGYPGYRLSTEPSGADRATFDLEGRNQLSWIETPKRGWHQERIYSWMGTDDHGIEALLFKRAVLKEAQY